MAKLMVNKWYLRLNVAIYWPNLKTLVSASNIWKINEERECRVEVSKISIK